MTDKYMKVVPLDSVWVELKKRISQSTITYYYRLTELRSSKTSEQNYILSYL